MRRYFRADTSSSVSREVSLSEVEAVERFACSLATLCGVTLDDVFSGPLFLKLLFVIYKSILLYHNLNLIIDKNLKLTLDAAVALHHCFLLFESYHSVLP